MRKSVTSVLALAVMLTQAAAKEIPQCDRLTVAHHAGETATIDIGAGHVAFQSWTSFPDTCESLEVVSCASARGFSVRTYNTENYDIRDEASALLIEAVESPERYNLEKRQALFEQRFEGRVQVSLLSESACGCEVAYPRLARTAAYAEPGQGL